MTSPGLLTDRYELTMLAAALRDGTAGLPCVFDVFARHLPPGRRYGVVAGTARVLDALEQFRFDDDEVTWLEAGGIVDAPTAAYLRGYRFRGCVDGYPEGELYFPDSPILTVRGTFAECVLLETVVLSILNHDCAVAAGAARMIVAAQERPVIEMGSRRVHEEAAIAAARAAYLAGFASTSNLAAGRRYGIPTAGTAAHAFTLLHVDEPSAFAAQIAAFGRDTTLVVDTYDIGRGIEHAVAVAGPQLGAIRIDSGDLAMLARQARAQLDALGATATRIVVSGDLDEYAIASLAASPIDAYGAGTAVGTGSGAPTAGLVYKLVEVAGRPVAKRSDRKATHAGAKAGLRASRHTGTATDELVVVAPPDRRDAVADRLRAEHEEVRVVTVPLLVDGRRTEAGASTLEHARDRLRAGLTTLPWEGLSLFRGDAALPTTFVPG